MVEQAADTAEAVTEMSQNKPVKNFSMPILWSFFNPVFVVTAAGLVKL